jgi:hypothetical protein
MAAFLGLETNMKPEDIQWGVYILVMIMLTIQIVTIIINMYTSWSYQNTLIDNIKYALQGGKSEHATDGEQVDQPTMPFVQPGCGCGPKINRNGRAGAELGGMSVDGMTSNTLNQSIVKYANLAASLTGQ